MSSPTTRTPQPGGAPFASDAPRDVPLARDGGRDGVGRDLVTREPTREELAARELALARLAAERSRTDVRRPRLSGLWFFLLGGSHSRRRLDGCIAVFRVQLVRHRRRTPDAAWIDAANELLDEARGALDRNDTETAWRCFHEASRLELLGLDRGELADRAGALYLEVEQRLGSWRRQAIQNLCAPDDTADERRLRSRLEYALQLRDEQFHNHYQKVQLLKTQLVILGGVVAALIAGIATYAAFFPLPLRGEPFPADWRGVALVLLFGALGGTISAATTLAGAGRRSSIPDQLVSWPAAIIRPLLGAAAAIALYVFTSTGAFGVGVTNGAAVLFLSFAAGFAERLVVRAVDRSTDGGADAVRAAEG